MAAATRCVVCGSASSPSKRRASHDGMVAPQRPAKPATCLKLWIGTMPGHDRRPDAARARRLQEAQVVRVVEEELRDDAAGAGVDLGLQVVEVRVEATGCRGASRDSRPPTPRSRRALEARDQVGGIGIAAGMRRCSLVPTPRRRIAAQGDDVADARLPCSSAPPRRPRPWSPARRSGARRARATSRARGAPRWRACARAWSRRRHRSPTRSGAAAARAAGSRSTAPPPSSPSWAGRTRRRR